MKEKTMTGKTIKAQHWLVYILRCHDGSFYTGITSELSRRLQEHHDGVGSRYTRSRLPVKLVYLESAANRSAATKRELAIKRMSREKKLSLLQSGMATKKEPQLK